MTIAFYYLFFYKELFWFWTCRLFLGWNNCIRRFHPWWTGKADVTGGKGLRLTSLVLVNIVSSRSSSGYKVRNLKTFSFPGYFSQESVNPVKCELWRTEKAFKKGIVLKNSKNLTEIRTIEFVACPLHSKFYSCL